MAHDEDKAQMSSIISKAVADGVALSMIRSKEIENANSSSPTAMLKHPAAGWVVGLLAFAMITLFQDLRTGGGSNALTLQDMQIKLATIETQLGTLTEQAKEASVDRYTSEDALRDLEAQALRDQRQNARLDKVENKIAE